MKAQVTGDGKDIRAESIPQKGIREAGNDGESLFHIQPRPVFCWIICSNPVVVVSIEAWNTGRCWTCLCKYTHM